MTTLPDITTKVNNCQATPGVTTWEINGGNASAGDGDYSIPAGISQNSLPNPGACEATTSANLCTLFAIPAISAFDYCVVGFQSLKSLLQPAHRYFRDKQARLVGWQGYAHEESGTTFLYPKVKGLGTRDNPYRRYQLARSHTSRTIWQLQAVVKNKKLTDLRILDLTKTIPSDLSEHLAGRKNGKSLIWAAEKRFFAKLSLSLGCGDGDMLACRTNLHTWSSSNPLNPHFHFHSLIPNYICRADGSFSSWFGIGHAKRYTDDDESRVGCVPFSDVELAALKAMWTKEVKATCKRIGFKPKWFENSTNLCDVYVSYLKCQSDMPQLAEKLGYDNRSWLEDYARYSNAYPDCPNPPEWLEGYSNRPRVFGWWARLTELAGDVVSDEGGDKISPLTGRPFEIKRGHVYPVDILECVQSGGVAGFLDVARGRNGGAKVYRFDFADLQWLASVSNVAMDLPPPAGGDDG